MNKRCHSASLGSLGSLGSFVSLAPLASLASLATTSALSASLALIITSPAQARPPDRPRVQPLWPQLVAQQMIDDSSGSPFMEEVLPAKPPQKPKPVAKPDNLLETLDVPVNPKGHIVPILTPGGGPVMPFVNKIETGFQPIYGYGGYYPFSAGYPAGLAMPYASPSPFPYGAGFGGYGGGLGLGFRGYGGGLGLGFSGPFGPYGYGNGPVGIFSPVTPFGAIYPGGFGLPYYSNVPFNIPLGRAGAIGGNILTPMMFPSVNSSRESSLTTFGGIAPASSGSDPQSLQEAANQLPGNTFTTSGSSSMRWLPGLFGGRASYSGSGLLNPLMGQ